MQLVEPQNQILPGIVSVEKKSPSLTPLRRRMGLAYDKLLMEAEEREGSLSPKTIRTLGKLVLEFEQVNTNLASIQAQIRQDIRDKKRYFDDEKKLYKKEEENLTSLRGSFFDLRSKFAGISAVLAGKALLEGRFGDAAANAGFAVTAMLPEIVNIASGLVLSRMALGGMGRAAAGATIARGGGVRMPGMGGLGMLGLAAAVPLTMGAADVRRQELVRRQTGSAGISPDDVDRFQGTITRFDAILSQKGGGGKAQEQPKVAVEEDPRGKDDKKPPPPLKAPSGDVFAGDILADTPEEKALIATVRETEGTAGKDGYSTFFGGSLYGGDLRKKTVAEVAELQKKFLREGRGRFYDAGTKTYRQSGVVGAGQFKYPEQIARSMGMDPAKTLFDEAFQNSAILYSARKIRGVDPSKPLTLQDIQALNPEWSGLGPYYGQTTRTIEQSLKLYQQNLREAQETKTTPKPKKSAQDSGMYGRYAEQSSTYTRPASSDISLITIPGQQKIAKPQGPKTAPASSEVAFNTTFESVDRFTSNLILGVYSS